MGKKYITYQHNPNIDFLFGYFGDMHVPTKQDKYKQIDVIQIDHEGIETIFNNFYQRKPDTLSVQKFKHYIEQITKNKFTNSDKIKMPDLVQVSLSISVNEKRFFDVDIDNLAKTVLDSLNGIAYDDDSQVTSLIVDKHVHPMNVNGLLVSITKLIGEKKDGMKFE